MNANQQINDFIRLRTMSSLWGDIYTGTKAQLNAAGFGVGCLFPGEPGGKKSRCTIPVAHGYAKVEVCVDSRRKHGTDTPFEDRVFEVSAYFLASDAGRYDPPTAFAPGIILEHLLHWDTYTGSAAALIQADIIQAHQLPGMPGCGKHITTFDAEGNILKRGSSIWQHPGRVWAG